MVEETLLVVGADRPDVDRAAIPQHFVGGIVAKFVHAWPRSPAHLATVAPR